MTTKTLEQELEGFTHVEDFGEYKILAKGNKRILYKEKRICLRYDFNKKIK